MPKQPSVVDKNLYIEIGLPTDARAGQVFDLTSSLNEHAQQFLSTCHWSEHSVRIEVLAQFVYGQQASLVIKATTIRKLDDPGTEPSDAALVVMDAFRDFVSRESSDYSALVNWINDATPHEGLYEESAESVTIGHTYRVLRYDLSPGYIWSFDVGSAVAVDEPNDVLSDLNRQRNAAETKLNSPGDVKDFRAGMSTSQQTKLTIQIRYNCPELSSHTASRFMGELRSVLKDSKFAKILQDHSWVDLLKWLHDKRPRDTAEDFYVEIKVNLCRDEYGRHEKANLSLTCLCAIELNYIAERFLDDLQTALNTHGFTSLLRGWLNEQRPPVIIFKDFERLRKDNCVLLTKHYECKPKPSVFVIETVFDMETYLTEAGVNSYVAGLVSVIEANSSPICSKAYAASRNKTITLWLEFQTSAEQDTSAFMEHALHLRGAFNEKYGRHPFSWPSLTLWGIGNPVKKWMMDKGYCKAGSTSASHVKYSYTGQ